MTTTPKTITKPTTVLSRHFQHHPEFAIGPEAVNVTAWSLAVTTAVGELPARPMDTYDCPLYRFAEEDGQLQLVVERRIEKPRTLVSGYKAKQRGSGDPPSDYTLLDDAFDLRADSEGFQMPEPILRTMLEAWANQHRRKLDGYQLLLCARTFSTLIAARHGVRLGIEDL
jgi:hypothetical protein